MSRKGLTINGTLYPFTILPTQTFVGYNVRESTTGQKFIFDSYRGGKLNTDQFNTLLRQESFIKKGGVTSDDYTEVVINNFAYGKMNVTALNYNQLGSKNHTDTNIHIVYDPSGTLLDVDYSDGVRLTPYGFIAVAFSDDDGETIKDCGIIALGLWDYNKKWSPLAYFGSWINQDVAIPDGFVGESKDDTPDTPSGGDGGVVTGKNPDVVVGVPDLPNIDVSVTGNTLYTGNANVISEFTDWLWSDDFITNIKKMYSDPSQAILGFSVIDANISVIRSENIHVGNLDTGVIANRANAWQTLDCGSMTLYEVYGAYTDYSPYIDVSLYLPKIGVIDVDPDIVMNNTVHIVYNYELITGSGICYILIKNNRDNTETIYKYIPCRVTASLPWSLQDRSQQVSAMINACTSTVMGGATGGAGGAGMALAQGVINTAMATPKINSGGNLSGVSSLLACKYPYFIIKRASVIKPTSYNKYHGYKLYATDTLSNHKGLTKCLEPRIDFGCPKSVEDEIKRHLVDGIIIE